MGTKKGDYHYSVRSYDILQLTTTIGNCTQSTLTRILTRSLSPVIKGKKKLFIIIIFGILYINIVYQFLVDFDLNYGNQEMNL